MADIFVRGKKTYHQPTRCANPECGSKRLFLHRENAHYRAYRCHECGQFVTEGDVARFCAEETALNQGVERANFINDVGELVNSVPRRELLEALGG